MKFDFENAIRVTMPPAEAEIIIAELNRLRAQNAELAEALKEAAVCLSCNVTPHEVALAIAKADEAFAKYSKEKAEKNIVEKPFEVSE